MSDIKVKDSIVTTTNVTKFIKRSMYGTVTHVYEDGEAYEISIWTQGIIKSATVMKNQIAKWAG